MSTTRTTTWTATRLPQDAKAVGYAILTFKVYPEDEFWIGECAELGVSNFGATFDEAMKATLNATELYLDTLEEDGQREHVFKKNKIKFFNHEPKKAKKSSDPVPLGGFFSPQRLVAVGA